MRLLLDTHIFLLLIRKELDHLGGPIASALTREETNLFISVATLWEIAIKTRLGKLDPGTPLERLPELIENMKLAVVPIITSHALEHVKPEPQTRDPFDRLLLAQCIVDGMRLVTLDRALVAHPAAFAPQ